MANISLEEIKRDLLAAETPDVDDGLEPVELSKDEYLSAPETLDQTKADLLSVGGGGEADIWDKLSYGFHKMPSDINNLAILGEAAGYTLAQITGARYGQEDGPGFEGHYGPLLMFDAQREVIARERDERIRKADAGMVEGTPEEGSWWVKGGMLGGAITTPTTLVPVGQSYKAAAFIGAGLGAWDATLYGLAQEGQIDGQNVALAAGAGAILAPLIMAGGKKFSNFLRNSADADIPVTAADIDDFVKTHNIQANVIGDSTDLATHINNSLGIGKKVRGAAQARKDMKAALKDDPEMTEFFRRYAQDEDTLRQMDKTKKAQEMDAAWAARENGNDELVKKIQMEKMHQNRTDKLRYEKEADVQRGINEIKKARFKEAGREGDLARMEDPRAGEYTPNPAMKEAYETAEAARDVATETFVRGMKEQGGYVQQQLMHSIASGSAGAAIGYGVGDEEGAMIGAVLGLGLPWAAGKTYRTIGKLGSKDPADKIGSYFGSENVYQSPVSKFKGLGKIGRVFNKMMQDSQENIILRTSEKMVEVEQLLGKYGMRKSGSESMHEVSKILQHTLDPAKATPEARKVANLIMKDFEDVVQEAMGAGVISKGKGTAMINKARKEGYWPRVYNEALLSTTKGKEMWVEQMLKQQWNEDSLRATLNTIMGNDRNKVGKFIQQMRKDGTTYTMTREKAIALWRERGKNVKVKRSGHLENDRSIHVESEDVLRPFLVDDPHVVLTEYFHDAYKRIEMAKMFGAKDEVAETVFKKMEELHGKDVTDSARTVYYTTAGDSDKSWIIRQHNGMSNAAKNIVGRINAFETLKLTFAQTINAGQAIVNGSTLVASRTGSYYKGLQFAIKGIRNAMSKEGREFAARSGAAFETTLMEIVGDMSQLHHSIVGKELTGMLTPLEYLNNPTKFLKATGFLDVEKAQRILGANMGKAYAEDLLSAKTKLMNLPQTNRISKKLNKVNRQLDELGLDSGVHPSKVSEGQMLRAGLRFSNEVNFKNTPDLLPLGWQSPYAGIFRKLKTFAFHHGRFIKDNVLKQATKGNLAPLMNYMAVGTPIGMSVDEFRRWIKGDDKELTMTERFLRGFTSVGGLGILMDVAYSSVYSDAGVTEALAGVVLSDVSKAAHGVTKSVTSSLDKGEIVWKPLAKAAASTVVYPGQKYVDREILSERRKRSSLGSSLGTSGTLGGTL